MSRIRRISDLINVLMLSLCIAITEQTLINFMVPREKKNYIVLLMGIFCINLIIYILRLKVRKLILYLAGHIALCAAIVVMLNIPFFVQALGIADLTAWVVFAGIMFVVDIAFWMEAVNVEQNLPLSETGEPIKGFKPIFREGFAHISVYFVAVFIVMMFLGIYAKYDKLVSCAYYSGIIYVGLYFIRMYLKNVSQLIDVVERGKGVARKRIIRSNTRIVIPLIVVLITAMLLFQSDATIELMNNLVKLLFSGIIILLLAIIALFSGGDVQEDDTVEGIQNAFDFGMGNNPLWLDAIYKILEYVLTVAVIALTLYLIVKFVIRLAKLYNMRSTNPVKKRNYDDMTEVSEHVHLSESVRTRRRTKLFSLMSNREKVRYLYRKYVHRAEKSGYEIKKNHTPNERSDDLIIMSSQEQAKKKIKGTDVVNITPIYNIARYSLMEINDNDIHS